MTPIAKSEAFFFISTIAVVILSVMTTVVLVFLVKTLRDIRKLVRRTQEEAEIIFRDVRELSMEVKRPGFLSRIVIQSIGRFFKK